MKQLLIFTIAALTILFASASDSVRFEFYAKDANKKIPSGWKYKGRPLTADVKYSIIKNKENEKYVLHIESNKASGVILRDISKIIKEYPFMSWKWRMIKYPDGADGRKEDKNDQAIGIYIGFGTKSSQSVAWTWETETPKQTTGTASLFFGAVKTRWFALRNKSDGIGEWKTEKVNALECLKKEYGNNIPESDIALSVSSNSQYTGTQCACELEYIEFSKK